MTEPQKLLLDALGSKVRLLTFPQVALLVGRPDATAGNIRRDVMQLLVHSMLTRKKKGKEEPVPLVRERRVLAVPPPLMPAPVLAWTPGEPRPSEEAVKEATSRGKAKWRQAGEVTLVSVVELTVAGSTLVTGRRGIHWARDTEASHDIALAELFLGRSEEERAEWRLEGHFTLPPAYQSRKRPDVMVSGAGLELIGSAYTHVHVLALVKALVAANLRFELW